ncbi:MAG: efflux RND transporter periplasmic adaptor subunit [Clostridia bacterium]
MKKKVDYRLVLMGVLIVILIGMVYFYYHEEQTLTEVSGSEQISQESSQITSEAQAEIRTITNTISFSGEIKSALEETIGLHVGYYFSEVYVVENEAIAEGDKILKYTNGTYLTAPYSCVITKLELPEIAQKCSSKHSVTLQAVNNLSITLQVEEEQSDSLSIGQEAQIAVNVYEDKVYTGYVTKISSTATYTGGSAKFSVNVEFPNDGTIKIGMSASCHLILEKAENVVAVPIEAIQTQNTKNYVTIIQEDGTTKQTQVTTGIQNDAYIEIKTGLEGNERIQITQTSSSKSSSSTNSQRSKQEGVFMKMPEGM